jgi:hypothetical protein
MPMPLEKYAREQASRRSGYVRAISNPMSGRILKLHNTDS